MGKKLEELDKLYGYNTSKPYDDEIAKLIKQGSYDKLLNKQIQAYNLKNNAQKYYENSLASQGLSMSGYGSSAMNSINNNAIKMYDQAESDFLKGIEQVDKATLERQDAKQTELDNQLVTFIQNDTTGDINKYLENYGYMKGGSYTDKWNNLSEERKAFINNVIHNKTANSGNLLNTNAQFDFSDLESETPYYDKNGKVQNGKLIHTFEKETQALSQNVKLGQIPNGASVELVNGFGDKLYVYYANGKFVYMTPKQYQNSQNKFVITYNDQTQKGEMTNG